MQTKSRSHRVWGAPRPEILAERAFLSEVVLSKFGTTQGSPMRRRWKNNRTAL